ncbi:MAG: cell envelope integrity protein TolA [Kiritimatiellae bacterium]|jgi:hypothetical protein|nr:cell envelope integrity protein TolA [Kiritimatiellia bacterium]
MKTRTKLLGTALVCLTVLRGYSDEKQKIRPGVSRGTVIHHLGEPKARIETKGSARYYYDRGEIRLEDDVVTYVSLMSEQAAEEKRVEAAKQRKLNTEQGLEVRDKILNDAEFAELPPSDRETFWKEFQERYPDVNVEAEYQKARLAARREAEKSREEERLANLEARVQAAEEQARRAELAAKERAWPDSYPRSSRVNAANEGIHIRYNTGSRVYYPRSSYLPVAISTRTDSKHSTHRWDSKHIHKDSNHSYRYSHPYENTYIYGRGGNTRLNIGRMSW